MLTNMVWENLEGGGDYGQRVAEFQMVVSKIAELLGRPNVLDFFPSLAWFDLQGVKGDLRKEVNKLDGIFFKYYWRLN